MTIRDTSTPVVALKAEHYGTLGIIRSLGRQGVPVFAIDPAPLAPAFASRYCAGGFVWDFESEPVQRSIGGLLQIGASLGRRSILLPTTDETALYVARHAGELQERYLFPRQRVELVTTLSSKKLMYYIARALDLGVPTSYFPTSFNQVFEIAHTARFPLALKGIGGPGLEKRIGKKMAVLQSGDELLREFRRIQHIKHSQVMLQEYISGPEDASWIYNGYYDADARCLIAFTGKKIRQNPVYAGMTSLGVCHWNPEIAETSERFLQRLGYSGIVDIDFRYDVRDGRYKILDVNPRIGASFRLFVGENGIDVARAMYLDLTRQVWMRTGAPDGRKWMVEDKDLRSSFFYFCDGKLHLLEWLRSFAGVEEAGYFSVRDQLPFWVLWTNHALRQLLRVWKFMGQRLRGSAGEPHHGDAQDVAPDSAPESDPRTAVRRRPGNTSEANASKRQAEYVQAVGPARSQPEGKGRAEANRSGYLP